MRRRARTGPISARRLRAGTRVLSLAIACAALPGCKHEPDPALACLPHTDPAALTPVHAYRIYIDGSQSMAPFLSRRSQDDSVPAYEEMIYQLFSAIPDNDTADLWFFGDSLAHLARGSAARQAVLTRDSYTRGESRLELAFDSAGAALDRAARPHAAADRAAQPRTMMIIVTDGLQSGKGDQLYQFARFNQLIRRHVERGGSFAFVAGMADRYPDERGRRRESAPVFAFLLADGPAVEHMRAVAARMAAALRPAGGGSGGGRYFLLPPATAAKIHLVPRRGVAQAEAEDRALHLLPVQPGEGEMEIVARVEMDSLAAANLPTALSVGMEQCLGRRWAPVPVDSSDWTAVVRKRGGGARLEATLHRSSAAAARGGLYRVRIEGSPVPDWVATEYAAGRTGTENDLGRFFEGVRRLAGMPASSYGTFYVYVRSR